MSSTSAYSERFFEEISAGTASSSTQLARRLLALTGAKSVLDVGCGTGTWLRSFKEAGVERVLGLDGDWVRPEMLEVRRDEFRTVDLSAPIVVAQTFDLAISLEVAEHLPESSAAALIALLTSAAPVVAFSAAIPFQGGTNHVNEQWPAYWIERFRGHRFVPIDAIRWECWDDDRVEPWYRQNLMLFVEESRLPSFPEIVTLAATRPPPGLAVVHPSIFFSKHIERADLAVLGVGSLVRALPRAVVQAVRRRISRT